MQSILVLWLTEYGHVITSREGVTEVSGTDGQAGRSTRDLRSKGYTAEMREQRGMVRAGQAGKSTGDLKSEGRYLKSAIQGASSNSTFEALNDPKNRAMLRALENGIPPHPPPRPPPVPCGVCGAMLSSTITKFHLDMHERSTLHKNAVAAKGKKVKREKKF